MIRKLIDFALENRFLVLAATILLFGWGAVSFHQLPVEAYPDVAIKYVDVIAHRSIHWNATFLRVTFQNTFSIVGYIPASS
jgi:Cu/Ag efflux pump CusA